MIRTYLEELLNISGHVVVTSFENSLSVVDFQVRIAECDVVQFVDQIRSDGLLTESNGTLFNIDVSIHFQR